MINMQFIMAQIQHPSSINYPKNLSARDMAQFHSKIPKIKKKNLKNRPIKYMPVDLYLYLVLILEI